MALDQRGKGTEILNAPVCASAKEHVVNLLAKQLLTRLKAHVVKRLVKTNAPAQRNILSYANTHARVSAVCNARLNIGGAESKFLVKHSIAAALESAPVSHSLVPLSTLRRILTPFKVFKSGLVRSNESATSPHLYREVAQGEPPLH